MSGAAIVRSLMLAAAATSHGLEIFTNDSLLFRQQFYIERKKAAKQGLNFNSLRCKILSPHTIYLINDAGEPEEL